MNRILAAFWAFAARQAWPADLSLVSSADAVSRGDLAHARRMGWDQLMISTDDVIAILAKASADLNYANSGAVDDMLSVGDFVSF